MSDSSKRREEICQNYSKLYRKKFEDSPQRRWPIWWGFECSDGWLDLIEDLSKMIQHHADWKISQDQKFVQPEVVQCKEKFGSLRFYIEGGDDYTQGLIAFAEIMSSKICEQCGEPGKLRRDGWLRTLCDPCHQKRTADHTLSLKELVKNE